MEKPAFLFLSHLHLKHIIGGRLLAHFRLAKGPSIAGPPGSRAALETLLAQPSSVPLGTLGYPVHLADLPIDGLSGFRSRRCPCGTARPASADDGVMELA